jgi:pimeloyl-ACP methyl ester carboxylesterase
MKLFVREFGDENRPKMLILHGLFGMSDNWTGIGKYYSKYYHVLIPDHRNHGLSPHSDDFGYELMLEDLLELAGDRNIEKAVVLGHSMGGKLAMNLAFERPEFVSSLIIADISMRAGEFRANHAAILELISRTDLSQFANYADLQAYFSSILPEKKLVQFTMKNIKRDGKAGFRWKLNYQAIYNNIHKVMEEVTPGRPYEGPVLVIRGEKSDYVTDEDFAEMVDYFPKAQLVTIPGASHWVHADDTPFFLRSVDDFLKIRIG